MTDSRASSTLGEHEVRAELVANVFRILVDVGEVVSKGDQLMILESMKMEIPVIAPRPGTVRRLGTTPDAVVSEGDVLLVLADSDPG
ncbi:biotin/lipoyl-binding carrier protein [Saccharopolyspora sp. NPDC002376]